MTFSVARRRRQQVKLIAVMVLFAAPLLIAWTMVSWRLGIPEARTAHGDLLPPVPALREWPLDGERPRFGDDWVLAYRCDAPCDDTADRWWRVHRALGREADRVTRLRLGTARNTLPGEVTAPWQVPTWAEKQRVWLIDPEGRVVVGYRETSSPDAVLADVRRLLRVNPRSSP